MGWHPAEAWSGRAGADRCGGRRSRDELALPRIPHYHAVMFPGRGRGWQWGRSSMGKAASARFPRCQLRGITIRRKACNCFPTVWNRLSRTDEPRFWNVNNFKHFCVKWEVDGTVEYLGTWIERNAEADFNKNQEQGTNKLERKILTHEKIKE